MRISVLGTIYMDIKGFPDDVYIPGGRNAGSIVKVHGGVGRNVAVNIARCGDTSVLLSLTEKGSSGQDVLTKLQEDGVDIRYILEKEDGMGTWLAIFGNDGDVVASISRRQDLSPLNGILLEHADEIFSQTDSVAFELDMDEELVENTLFFAEKYYKPAYALISNMSIAMERLKYFSRIECFVCNLQEAGMLFEKDFKDISAEELAAIMPEAMKRVGLRAMVVTMGEKGAVYADLNDIVKTGFCPAKKVDVVDTTGAGDAFFSGLVMSLSRGASLKEACQKATVLAASVIGSMENVCPPGHRMFTECSRGLTPCPNVHGV